MRSNLQFKFNFSNGARSIHQISIVNNSESTQKLEKSLALVVNTDIQNPWGMLAQNASIQRANNPDGLSYTYFFNLNSAIDLHPGENILLVYGVANALGNITNVAMPPTQVFADDLELSNFYQNNPQLNPNPNFEFNLYDASWQQYAPYYLTMVDEDAQNINCLTYAFIGFDSTGSVFTLDNWGDQLELPLLNIWKQNKPYLNTSISFGGWTNAGKRMNTVFSEMAANSQSRQNFLKNAVNAALQAGVNGIDIDWEYPDQPNDPANFVLLLQELRQEMNARLNNPRLTIASPAAFDKIQNFTKTQWQQISAAVDRISMMTYDYFGGFSGYADFHSPIDLSPSSPNQNSAYCISKTLQTYKEIGVDPKKLTLGIPNYGRGVIVSGEGQFKGLYQPVKRSAPGDYGGSSEIYSWDNIAKFLNNDKSSTLFQLGVEQWNYFDSSHPYCQAAQMSMLSGKLPNDNDEWVVITFIDPKSAEKRGGYIAENHLAGAMFWCNTKDKSITASVSSGLKPPSYESTLACLYPKEREYFEHFQLLQKEKDELAQAKAKLMAQFFALRNNLPAMMDFLSNKENKKILSEHRNLFKYATVKILGEEKISCFFKKPKSMVLSEDLLEEAKRRLS